MMFLGLTGVLGSGKSTVARLLKERGLDVIDLDSLAKESLTWKETQDDIRATFGDEYVVGGAVDTARLRETAFNQSNALRKLEMIVHPRVREEMEKRIEALTKQGARAVVFDHPLLFETGFDKKVDKVVVVTADMKTIRRRLRERGMQADDVERRLDFQIPLEQKAARADYVIDNNGTAEELQREVDLFLEKLTGWEEERNASH
ncbi:MAG TPA: dephospho-CoA kinase [Syntrophorhabdales bacterium]|nr:dephospho-CoA kinase [Syntrophorhabdales bacterium]